MTAIKYTYKDNTDFDYLISQLENPTILLRGWTSYRTSQFNQQMSTGVGPNGEGLAPLSAAYAQRKAKDGYGGKPIRVRTGATKASYKCEVQGRRVVETVGSKVAGYLQDGTSKMPARPLLPTGDLPSKDQAKLLELALLFVERSIKR